MMKKLTLVLALLVVTAGTSMAATATFDVYAGWNMVSAPLVPFNPVPSNPSSMGGDDTGVFDPLDIDFGGALTRWDAPTSSEIGWSVFSPESFGNILLGDGYWLNQASAGTVSYQGVENGVPDSAGVKTDMWISLPGNQIDGVDAGGWHIIGTPFNEDVSFSAEPFSALGDNILVTDGSTMKTWGEAFDAGWIDDAMIGWDNATNSQFSAGHLFAMSEYMERGKGYWCHTNKDNLALIVPANP